MISNGRPDPNVWAEVLAHRDRAVRVARARCSSPNDVQDCVQEALARVAAMPNLDLARIGPLITAVVSNLAVDAHRQRARTDRTAGKLRRTLVHPPPHEDDVCDRHEARWLRSQMDGLTAQDRQALELRASGLRVGEIAREMGVTYKAAENALGRARLGMRAVWRATAALLGVLWGVRREPRRTPAAPALATAALAAAVLTVAFVEPTPAATPRTDGAGRAYISKAPPSWATPPGSPVPRQAPSVAKARTESGTGRAAPAATTTTRVSVPPIRTGLVDYGGLRQESRPRGETPQEGIERCLRHVTITVERIECDG